MQAMAPAPERSVGKSLYQQYKYCTGTVLQWGLDTWDNRFGEKKKHAKKKKRSKKKIAQQQDGVSLTIKFDRLKQLANAGVHMPDFVCGQLRTAIKLREKVGKFYRSNPSTSEPSLQSHEWIIQQLRIVLHLFANRSQETQVELLEYAFSALATIADDEGDDKDDDEVYHVLEDNLPQPPPRTEEHIEEEDRYFAIACTLVDIADIRSDVRHYWKEWANKEWTNDDGVEVGELVAVSVFSNFMIQVVKKMVLQTQLELDISDDFELIFEGDDNLCLAPEHSDQMDDTLRSLKEIYSILKRFDLTSVPQQSIVKFGASDEKSKKENRNVLQPALTRLEESRDDFRDSIKQRNIPAFTRLLVEKYFPIWMAYSVETDSQSMLLPEYLDHFMKTGKVSLHLAFLILVLADSSFEQEEADPARADDVSELVCHTLLECCDEEDYNWAEERLEACNIESENEDEEGTSLLLSQLHTIHQYVQLWSPMSFLLPLWSGALLIHHLQLHLNASVMLPMIWRDDIIMLLHMYRMLRVEGFLDRIPEIEDTMIGMYHQNVFFRAGLPKTGKYTRNFQFALGYSPADVQRSQGTGKKGNRGGGLRPSYRTATDEMMGQSMNIQDISQLCAIIDGQSISIVDTATCFNEIHEVATRECHSMHMAPLMNKTLFLKDFMDGVLLKECLRVANEFFGRFIPRYASDATKGDNFRLTYWATTLGDHTEKTFRKMRNEGLSLLAKKFAKEFDVNATDEPCTARGEEVLFAFNPVNPNTSVFKDEMDSHFKRVKAAK